jgi:hypothetical protein
VQIKRIDYIFYIASYHYYLLGNFYLFELNAWEDEWLVAIKTLQEGKRKLKNVREKGKKNDLVCGRSNENKEPPSGGSQGDLELC